MSFESSKRRIESKLRQRLKNFREGERRKRLKVIQGGGSESGGSVSGRNSLGNRIRRVAESRVLIRFERKLHLPLNAYRSPPHLLRIVALSRQPDLHAECTYGRLYRGPYEKRDAALFFRKKEKKINKRRRENELARLFARARVRPFHREFLFTGRTS